MDGIFDRYTPSRTVISFDFSTDDPMETPMGLYSDLSEINNKFLKHLQSETFLVGMSVHSICKVAIVALSCISIANSHFGQCKFTWNESLKTFSGQIDLLGAFLPQNDAKVSLTHLLEVCDVSIFAEGNHLSICADLRLDTESKPKFNENEIYADKSSKPLHEV